MKNIQKSLAVVARDEKAISPSSRSPYYPFAAASGTGALLKDADGNALDEVRTPQMVFTMKLPCQVPPLSILRKAVDLSAK